MAFIVQNANSRNTLTGTPFEDEQRLVILSEDPPITPLQQDRHQHHQVLPIGVNLHS
jgi:hypothetical protein